MTPMKPASEAVRTQLACPAPATPSVDGQKVYEPLTAEEHAQLLALLSKATMTDFPAPNDQMIRRQTNAGWLSHLHNVSGMHLPHIGEQGKPWSEEQKKLARLGEPETPFTYQPVSL